MNAVMKKPVLVLNKSWQPIHVMEMSEAITKVFVGAAKVVDPDDYRTYEWEDWASVKPRHEDAVIKGGSLEIKAPEVIVLTKYDKVPNAAVTFNRRNVYLRDKHCCQYCGKSLSREQLTIDHVTPRAQGGTSTWKNCVVACFPCNSKKADRTPEQANMKLLSSPKKPKWTPSLKKGKVLSSWEKFISDMYWDTPLES